MPLRKVALQALAERIVRHVIRMHVERQRGVRGQLSQYRFQKVGHGMVTQVAGNKADLQEAFWLARIGVGWPVQPAVVLRIVQRGAGVRQTALPL